MPNPNHPSVRAFTAVERTFTKDPDSDISNLRTQASMIWTDSRGGMPNPLWRQLVAERRNATTPIAGQRYKFEGQTSRLVETTLVAKQGTSPAFKKITRRYAGDIIDSTDLNPFSYYSNPTLELAVTNEALVGFLNKCSSARRRLQGGVLVGEIKETLNTLFHPGKGIRKAIDAYYKDAVRRTRTLRRFGRRTNPIHIKDVHKVLSDTWLETAFGIKPMIADAKSAAEALAELATRNADLASVRFRTAREVDTLPGPAWATYEKAFNFFTVYRVNQKETSGVSVWMKGQVKLEVEHPLKPAFQIFGFTPEDFVPTIWELIPYSWLVDYFTNMGDLIQAWCFPRSQIAWFTRSVWNFRSREIQAAFSRVANNDPNYITEHTIAPPLALRLNAVGFRRDGTDLGWPSLVFQIPGVSSTKWLNIAALADMRVL